jgi:hypothetical protein
MVGQAQVKQTSVCLEDSSCLDVRQDDVRRYVDDSGRLTLDRHNRWRGERGCE